MSAAAEVQRVIGGTCRPQMFGSRGGPAGARQQGNQKQAANSEAA